MEKISTLKYSSKESNLVPSFRFSKCVSIGWTIPLENLPYKFIHKRQNLGIRTFVRAENSKAQTVLVILRPSPTFYNMFCVPETGSVQTAFSSLPFQLASHLVPSVRDSERY